MQSIIQTLSENIQLIYRKAIDADATISQLQQSGKGKFSAIFSKDSGFTIGSRFFKPYVEELAQEVLQLEKHSTQQCKILLPPIVKKIELLLTTLGQFQKSAR
jgi:hypothetical protein